MRRFRFSLAPLFDLRVRADDDCRRALALAARGVADQYARGTEIRRALARAADELRASCAGSTPFAHASTAGLSLLNEALEVCERRLQELRAREAAAREAFAAARAERRRLEALREREWQAFATEVEHHEAAALDEANEALHNAATLSAFSLHN